jgi:hypothetical protein
MGEVVRFPVRLRPIQPMTPELICVRDALIKAMDEFGLCPACRGRGVIFYPAVFGPADMPCPCGGDDENRIEIDGPDYPGAA